MIASWFVFGQDRWLRCLSWATTQPSIKHNGIHICKLSMKSGELCLLSQSNCRKVENRDKNLAARSCAGPSLISIEPTSFDIQERL
jgi:hypothetical protein